ncbi:DUF6875 domain-containing protein [Hyalangium rubrum]|uniref:DUF6875 domain-containing protein n=1 Tax=Hyalangium rubrum TaxID=3103134 RepID=A0ABU5HF86_9BACT|nr:hypothetical protein [Hyalangium sp. s54d21]MDY7232133.1 hypothetical protein [Hyalangium sp. s54d21]
MHHALDVLALEEGALLEGQDAQETAVLRAVAQWSRDYLTRPHPAVGRTGAVCPWVEKSIQQRLYHLTLLPEAHLRMEEAERTLLLLLNHFLEMPPTVFRQGQFKAIVTIFNGLPGELEAEFISGLHDRLRPAFVKQGLMLGEFYPSCVKTGLHNRDWYPLRSSPPLLVIRSMVRPDIAFLHTHEEFVQAYLGKHQQEGCTELRNYIARNREHLAPGNVSMLEETLLKFQQAKGG